LRQEGGSVALLDGSFQFGDVPVVLNIHSRADITSLVRHAEDLETELLMETLVSHSSGISVLSAPSQLEEAGAIDPQAMTAILRALQRQFEYVVIDAWPFLDENTLAMLEMSDRILLVITPEMPALRETRLFLEVTDALDYPPSKLLLVLNRAMSAFGIDAADIEENIRYKIAVNIPSDGRLVTRSLNRGVPLIVSDPQSQVARAIVRLASLLIDGTRETVPQEVSQTRRKRSSGLSHRLRPLLASQ
jgi:pilus assembly protein CpaE